MLRNSRGQNAIEYILLLIIIILALVYLLSPAGIFTQAVDQSLNLSVIGIENMANNVWP